MAEIFKGIVRLTEEQYALLSANGFITVNGNTITYDPRTTMYITPDTIKQSDFPTIIDLEAISGDYQINSVILNDGTQELYITGADTYSGGINIDSVLLEDGTQELIITEEN